MLYRSFPLLPEASATDEGGPLFVPRFLQGHGRHDNPDRYGALYLSHAPESVVAELLRFLRRHDVSNTDLVSENRSYSLVAIDERELKGLLDLDDPRNLVRRTLRPSGVATGKREVTRRVALDIYEEGVPGFEWWSAIEASWINVTLFVDRAVPFLGVADEAQPLTVGHPAVRAAAEVVGVRLID
jgi:RES domain